MLPVVPLCAFVPGVALLTHIDLYAHPFLYLVAAPLVGASFVLLLAVGYRTGAKAPVFADIPARSRIVDPVVQALTLTDVVVEATVSALLLALAVQAHKRFGTVDPDELGALRG